METMADLGTVIILAQNLVHMLNNPVVRGMIQNKSELKKLSDAVSIVKNLMLDAENKRQLTNEEKGWVMRLKDDLYDADDLVDEIRTVGELKQFNKGQKNMIRQLFSPETKHVSADKISKGVQSIRMKLEAHAADLSRYGLFKFVAHAVQRRREETYSCLREVNDAIVGRSADVEAIMNRLDFDADEFVDFLAIVGVGGLGKTTLAQLVYNDERVLCNFPMRLWVCVADEGQDHVDLKSILGKMIESATGKKPDVDSTIELVQLRFREALSGRKLLLVLDDFWNEDYYEWCKLRNFLMHDLSRVSKVIVTTRSMKTARIVGGIYELKGLSSEDSWSLFEMIAFGKNHKEQLPVDLVEIGKKIVERCSNVPLAIKMVGGLLFGEPIHKWRSFKEIELAHINRGDNQMMSTLMLSYQNLKPSLKACFSYCSLFPKEAELDKEMLISLWRAQGYIVALDGGQTIEDAGEEHFSILLRRCFFEVLERDLFGDVKTFKLHKLMHDLAQAVAGEETCVANSITNNLPSNVRHVFYEGEECAEDYFNNLKLRSCHINIGSHPHLLDALVSSCPGLRALGLSSQSKILANSIGKLLHLRSLALSRNRVIETLPNSITELYNLETLLLRDCSNLRYLPRNFSKLVKMRCLAIHGCDELTCMPPSMDKLTSLCVLTKFVAANEKSKEEHHVGQLKDLKALVNLKGAIDINICRNYESATRRKSEGRYLAGMKHLNAVGIHFTESDDNADGHEYLIEDLKPNYNLRGLKLSYYLGENISSWGSVDNWAVILPNLVKIRLLGCYNLKYLPSLSKMQHLKSLKLSALMSLEYMEEKSSSSTHASAEEEDIFFPSLEILEIKDSPKLGEWWRSKDSQTSSKWKRQPSFERLSSLQLCKCPELTSFPPCPRLERLQLFQSNKKLQITSGLDPSSSFQHRDASVSTGIRNLYLDWVGYLNSLPVERLTSLDISDDDQLESLSEVGEIFKSCNSLQSLNIANCPNMKSLSDGGLEHLNSLKSLELINCPNLESLPEEIVRLTSLVELTIEACSSKLTERCQDPSSEDRAKLQHIPHVTIVGP